MATHRSKSSATSKRFSAASAGARDWRRHPLTSALFGIGVLLVAPSSYGGVRRAQGTIDVSNCNDGGAGSLRQAINDAPDGATVNLTALNCSVITLGSNLRVDQAELDIIGPGTALLTVDSDHRDRTILHSGTGRLTVTGITLANGTYRGGFYFGARGGCIYSEGTVALEDAIVRDCTLTSEYSAASGISGGGCIFASENVSLTDSKVTGCTATFADDEELDGGGILSLGGGIVLIRSTISGVRTMSGFTLGVALAESSGGLTVKYSTIDDNRDIGDPTIDQHSQGGGFQANGPVYLRGSTISNNSANSGAGGVAHMGSIRIENSTISNNATQNGPIGGLALSSSSEVVISNSTIAFNHGNPAAAGGVSLYDVSVLVQSSIIANNTAGSAGRDIGGTNSSIGGSHNLIQAAAIDVPPDTQSGDPGLLPLDSNGGTTRTHALASASPAIDQGDNPLDMDTDQRRSPYVREFGAATDIGAFEVQPRPDPIFENGFEGT